jgi:hypothetical protein
MSNEDLESIEQRYLQQIQQTPPPPRPPLPPLHTIPYTELTEDSSGQRGAQEWNFYCRQVGRLLAEGHEGKWVLIRGEAIIGIWDTEAEANQLRLERFPVQDVLIHQVRSREPVFRGPIYLRQCSS